MTNRKRKVLFSWRPGAPDQSCLDAFRSDPSLECIWPEDKTGFLEAIKPGGSATDLLRDVDAIVSWAPIPRIAIQTARKLKFICYIGGHYQSLDLSYLRERGIHLATAQRACAVASAEQAMAFLLGLAKRVRENHAAVQTSKWGGWWDPATVSQELQGKTVCLVGYGRVGQALASRCAAFGMKVLAIRRSQTDQEEVGPVTVGGPDRFRDFFARSDFAILSLPLVLPPSGSSTRNLIDAQKLGWLRPTALLINIAHAHLVDEAALESALSGGRLAGYAASVWWEYGEDMPPDYHFPVPSRFGIHQLHNVITSAEVGSDNPRLREQMIAAGLESLSAFLRKQPIPGQVDLNLGY